MRECDNYIKENKKLPTGMAIVTNGGSLNCGYVIHAVGLIYDENDPETANKKMIQVIQSKYFNFFQSLFLLDNFKSKESIYEKLLFYRYFTINDWAWL